MRIFVSQRKGRARRTDPIVQARRRVVASVNGGLAVVDNHRHELGAAGGKGFEEAKEEIREILTQEQTSSYRDQYLAELKRSAVIEVRMPELKD